MRIRDSTEHLPRQHRRNSKRHGLGCFTRWRGIPLMYISDIHDSLLRCPPVPLHPHRSSWFDYFLIKNSNNFFNDFISCNGLKNDESNGCWRADSISIILWFVFSRYLLKKRRLNLMYRCYKLRILHERLPIKSLSKVIDKKKI